MNEELRIKMNEELRRLGQEFTNRNEDNFVTEIVSHTPEAVREFSDLTARVVEMQGVSFLTIHTPNGQSLVRARIWSKLPEIMTMTGHPDRGCQQDRFVGEVCLRPFQHEYSQGIHSPKQLLPAIRTRRVDTRCDTIQTHGSYCSEVQVYELSMRPAKSDTSRTAEIVCEALRDGTPLGETEQRRARMNFLRYNAGQGRVGSAAECGYVLQRDNDIFVVPTSGLFCIDEDDGVTGAVNVPDLSCYDCDRDLRIDLRDTLEKTLQGQDLANRRVFFVASNSSGPGEGCGRSAHQAAEMLRERGATVYATVRDAEGLI